MVKYSFIHAFNILKNILSQMICGATRVIFLNKKYYSPVGGREMFTSPMFPRQCSLILLVSEMFKD
jgi:hypothetical protein